MLGIHSFGKNLNFQFLFVSIFSFNNVFYKFFKKLIINLRFKRVADYNEMDSKEAFIVETLNNGGMQEEIIKGLIDNYNIKRT